MHGRIRRWFEKWFEDSGLADYQLPDPDLTAYDHGVGTLIRDGEPVGHLASVRLEMTFPGRQWWPWFVIVWKDGTKERSFEDYGPLWPTVRELDAGYFDRRGDGAEVYSFAWLPPEEAARTWLELGLTDDDF
ncbi:hypothetical protein [Micropruina sp.]|uniref:hypothetical protein n=1 Tax=Micropruina sp. TaxID=2737536 RepID=UPI00262F159E|nr:hypothetical protein [Micropruina sp.]